MSIQARSAIRSASALALLQMVAMALPLLSLPVMARALGVALFGQVMLAQFVVFFAVVFVDAGMNTESQRRVVVAGDDARRRQALLDNLLARSVLALLLCVTVLGLGAAMPGLPLWMVGVALLHLLGTLVFPQWWYVAREQGLAMGLASAAGRLVGTLIIVLWVRTPADAGLALLAMSLGSLLSGLLLLPLLLRECRQGADALDWLGWRLYLRQMRSAMVPGFVASSAQSLPGVTLGYLAGSVQVGLYSAADRLTRAGAHVGLIATQSLLNVAARWHQQGPARSSPGARLLPWLAMALALCAGVLGWLAPWLVHWLYGSAFAQVVPVLQCLGVWLALYLLRHACVVIWLTSRGQFQANSRLQWQEGLGVALACVALGPWGGALGVAAGLLVVECSLMLRLHAMVRRGPVVSAEAA